MLHRAVHAVFESVAASVVSGEAECDVCVQFVEVRRVVAMAQRGHLRNRPTHAPLRRHTTRHTARPLARAQIYNEEVRDLLDPTFDHRLIRISEAPDGAIQLEGVLQVRACGGGGRAELWG